MPTVYHSPQRPKPFAWSFSRLKNYETCPKKYYHLDVVKDVPQEESEQLTYGNAVHKMLADALVGKKPIPDFHKSTLQPWVERVGVGNPAGGKLLVEQKLAIRADFSPCGYFDKDVWYRGVVDAAKLVGPVALAVDWKTGKIKEDYVQLGLMAACIFSHHPEVQRVRTIYAWLQEDAETIENWTRQSVAQLWAGVLPRVSLLEAAHKTTTFPAKPGGLCKRWCPVVSCPHNGANE